eukprot:1166536-Lingulodinium_polyedra.AAC.1
MFACWELPPWAHNVAETLVAGRTAQTRMDGCAGPVRTPARCPDCAAASRRVPRWRRPSLGWHARRPGRL